MPGVVERVLPLCLDSLGSSGRERVAASSLLVRLWARPDMQKSAVSESLLRWALHVLDGSIDASQLLSIYSYVGLLSFLSGVLALGDHSCLSPSFSAIFSTGQRLFHEDSQTFVFIRSSASARKLLIKILRSLTILVIKGSVVESLTPSQGEPSEILESTIDILLSCLADKDTPVRFASSKALSMITQEVEEGMAAEIVEAILDSLAEDVRWLDPESGKQFMSCEIDLPTSVFLSPVLTAVNALRWHGLTLSLAHLLFRRSPPLHLLPKVLNALILALSFEQRSTTGSAVGSNVRDAACFGVWSLSRKYSTDELINVDCTAIQVARKNDFSMSVPQILATELVAAASLDSVGNIRRGASAALQELIGRHPDTIISGIALVQVVDYHAVARRSRAISEVAVEAATLHPVYWETLFSALLTWKGLRSSDAASRRSAAHGVGLLSSVVAGQRDVYSQKLRMTDRLSTDLTQLQPRMIEERHGILLALANIVHDGGNEGLSIDPDSHAAFWKTAVNHATNALGALEPQDFTQTALRPEMSAEAACTLITSIADAMKQPISGTAGALPDAGEKEMRRLFISHSSRILTSSLSRPEQQVIKVCCSAAKSLFDIQSYDEQKTIIRAWVGRLENDGRKANSTTVRQTGFIKALGSCLPQGARKCQCTQNPG